LPVCAWPSGWSGQVPRGLNGNLLSSVLA